jgi:hypothetical protein
MQYEDSFCDLVAKVCQPLLDEFVCSQKIDKVQFYSFANERMLEAISNYSNLRILAISGCRFVRGESLLQLKSKKLQSLNCNYSEQIKGTQILACVL